MKVSKSLLQAIAVGITLSASAASCSLFEEENLHLQTCGEECDIDHRDDGGTVDPDYNCPGCGMG